MEKIAIAAAFRHLAPANGLAEIARLNEASLKVGRFRGRFAWHSHEREDELFWVIAGRLTIQFRDRDVVLESGEFIIVPAGVEHRSVADEESHVLIIHPHTTVLPPAK
jgi:mannose-6-phosphate isomerase-like protein (cupin superfamily)